MNIKYKIGLGIFFVLFLSFTAFGKAIQNVDIITVDRPWLHENEFLNDQALHATRDQTVVLHLEAWDGRSKPIKKNSLRFSVDEPQRFSFCIPREDRHLLGLKLKRHGGPTLLNGSRGGSCDPIMLKPGRYQVDVFHDSRSVPSDGIKAFFHRPSKPRLLGGLDAAAGTPDFIAFRASNNQLVSGPVNAVAWQATAMTVSPREVWRMTPEQLSGLPGTFYLLTNDTVPAVVNTYERTYCPPDSTMYVLPPQNPGGCFYLPSPFLINDHGGGMFNLVLTSTTLDLVPYSGGIFTKDDGTDQLFYDTSKNFSGETMTWEYKGYDCVNGCDSSTLPLRSGEIALYSQCDFQGPAMVFSAARADLSLYDSAADQELAIGNNMLSSIRVGPNTLAILYDEAQFGGNVVGVGADVACLDSVQFDKRTSSFQIDNLREYIVSTNGCTECVLTGIDLSDEIFTNMDFTNTIFDEAILTETIFNSATLEATHFSGAMLDGAEFIGANLSCTQFDNTDLSSVALGNNEFRRDFYCRLNLFGSTLDYTDFPVEDWRYFDLTASKMNNVPNTLSTMSTPLDLSGIKLSGVQWLAGKTLDYANFGCYSSQSGQTTVCPESNGAAVCSTLQGTVLSGASLKRACLREASMEGVFLSFSNLDGADMKGVQLQALSGGKVATLEGAFMRNVDLSGADLTGITANNVDFYTASGGKADATGVTAPGANFTGAYLAFADFSGAQTNLQSTIWTDAMLLGANFRQADLSTNTSGGVNSGTNTTFDGAYLQGADFASAVLDDVNFINTYWDAFGSGGSLNLLIPKQNLQFSGYWKDLALPECPQALTWNSGILPPMGVTNSDNTCPTTFPGPCDTVWGQPHDDISQAFFKSAKPTDNPAYPQDPNVSQANQCSSDLGAPNSYDLCWTITTEPPPTQCQLSP